MFLQHKIQFNLLNHKLISLLVDIGLCEIIISTTFWFVQFQGQLKCGWDTGCETASPNSLPNVMNYKKTGAVGMWQRAYSGG